MLYTWWINNIPWHIQHKITGVPIIDKAPSYILFYGMQYMYLATNVLVVCIMYHEHLIELLIHWPLGDLLPVLRYLLLLYIYVIFKHILSFWKLLKIIYLCWYAKDIDY